ncbi:YfbU family protein [Bacillus sp. FDAARGOS_235]|uniref:YfbU family protein n=1 Tax=Bacillus sp. FDAARGOS_235 TaxID=1839798 RepID=UPI0011A78D61|nr:YfbU family protein [Bacillus sp. FDAARGOS_235]
MKLTKSERLILINQYTILGKLYPEDKTHSYNKEILINGYTSNYDELFDGLHEDVPEEVCKEVWDILQMHRSLKFSFDDLEDKGDLKENDIKFQGFDGNDETDYMVYAKFIIHDMDRYKELKNEHCDYNTHFPTLSKYKRMVSNWKNISDRYNNKLSLEQLKSIINA